MVQTSDKFAIWIAIGRIFSMLATFIMPLVLTRYLSISDYGVFSQFFTLYTVLYAMFAFGMHTNLFFFYPNAEKKEKDEYVSNTLLTLCLLGAVAGIIMCLPMARDAMFGESELSQYKYLVIACIALAVPINIISPLFSVREDKIGVVILPALVAITNYLPWWNIARMLCIAVASLFPLFLAKFHGIPFMIDMILAVFYILAVYLIYLKLGLFIIREETLKHYLIRIRTAIYK